MPSMTLKIDKNNPLHKKLTKMVGTRIKLGLKAQTDQHEKWQKAEDTVLAYVPESDLDSARRRKRESDGEPKYTTIKLPYTYALLMAAHTYLTSVFFARSPVHQFAGRHGETEDQVQALEALIAYQTLVGEMMAPYYLWLYDALKYGIGVLEEFWELEEIQHSTIQMAPKADGLVGPDGQPLMEKVQVQARGRGYEGMRGNNLSPYDFICDPRVTIGNYQKGEFCGARKRISWSTVKRREAQGFYMNVDFLTGGIGKDFYESQENSQLERPDDTAILEADDVNHPAALVVYELCVELFPREWGLGPSDFPEKWMFTITGDLSTLIGVQPHGAAHGKFPYAVLESEVEPYGTYSRGIPEIAEPIQNTMDWLINTHFFNVRAAMNNQFIIDPSKVVAKDAEKAGPGFLWRLRPSAYGEDIRKFVHQIPVQDMTRGNVTDLQVMLGVGERVFGINDQILGALSGSGRKTATEVRTTTGFGVNRLKTITEYMSAGGFAAHAMRLVQMSQQYFSAERKFRIVGGLLSDMNPNSASAFMNVTPDSIKGFYDFVPVDGTLPVDRLAMANLWKEILAGMQSMPAILMQYDMGKIFAHVAQLAGIRNLNQFKIQVGTPEALAQQTQAGNLIALGGRKGGGGNARGVGNAGPSAAAANMPVPQ